MLHCYNIPSREGTAIGAGRRPAELAGRFDDLGGGAGLLLAGRGGLSPVGVGVFLSCILEEASTELSTVSTEDIDNELLCAWKRGGAIFFGFATSSSSKRYRKSNPNSCKSYRIY